MAPAAGRPRGGGWLPGVDGELGRAVVLDPLSPARQADVAATYIYACQYECAAEAYRSALALDPGSLSSRADLAFVYALMGRHAEAIHLAEQAQAQEQAPQEQWPLTALGYAYARAGLRANRDRAGIDRKGVSHYGRATTRQE